MLSVLLSGSSYVGWVPKVAQSGSTLDWTRLSPRGVRQMKQTMYLIVWRAIQWDEGWKEMYERLISRKCRSDERTRRLIGREKVIGRLAGQMASVMYTLLKYEDFFKMSRSWRVTSSSRFKRRISSSWTGGFPLPGNACFPCSENSLHQ